MDSNQSPDQRGDAAKHHAAQSPASEPAHPPQSATSSGPPSLNHPGVPAPGSPATSPDPGVQSHDASGRATPQAHPAHPEDPAELRSATTRWARLLSRTVNSMFKAPKNPGAPDELPESDTGTPQPIPALHPISMGFLGTIGVGLALAGYYLLTNVGSLITWISIALFIALGLDPVVRFLMRRGLNRPLAVTSTMVGLLAVFGGFMALIIPTLIAQITQFISRAPEIVDNFLNSPWVKQIDAQYAVSARINTEVERFFGDSGAVTNVFGGVLGVSQTVAQSMFGVLIVLVLAIYFLASLPGMMSFSLRLVPRSKRTRADQIITRITRSVGNYVMGQASVAVLNALVALILMTLLKVPFAALLTLLVAMLAFIPLVGAVIAGVLVTLVTLTLGWQTALIYAICYFGYLQVEAYFISPRIMNKAVAVPGAVAVISVIAGGTLVGITGALMAIPVAASAMILLREVFIARQDRL
ncbi:AI-2E family transporter [Glutamicibacter sp.]|uniref:AI-2E family transporter n=1 Tax=Glutamicibacter sp. TaxID=1931995 RepID=UPI002B468102|nr:AI-2E family transporter [Glutamicibacter sp.]HJX77372.1 AI-2E family transporter [Glutamicibacter sp.]